MQKVNILLVDDNPNNLLTLESILDAPDRNLVQASSGEEALRYLLDHEVAVVLLDVHMPHIDGLETAALIRGRERTANLPIIFLTAYDSAGYSNMTQGYSLGAVDYIVKPIDRDALTSKVAVFVELFRKTEQVKQQAELLHQKNIELEHANLQRLSRLIDLGQQLVAERDLEQLLKTFCHEACDIMGVRYSALGMVNGDSESSLNFCVCGFELNDTIRDRLIQANRYFLESRPTDPQSPRLRLSAESARSFRLRSNEFPFTTLLVAPLLQHGRICGWLYLADKIDHEEFNEADERLAVTLTSQAAVAYENARLYAQMENHTSALEQEIAERKLMEKARAELLVSEQAARKQAETANRLKDEFLATVSHELRTPLNAMLGWVSIIRKGNLEEERKHQALETIERNARLQKRLIDDLLDVSRIITGKLRLDTRLIDLVMIIEGAVESVRPAAEAKAVSLQTELEVLNCPFQGDSSRLQQVIWNLISNAVKFTPTGGQVKVRLRQCNEQVEIIVSDTGAGIAPEFLPYVFDRFRQADGSSTRKHGGLGLGLAIVRHLVEMHGGTVEAESAGKNQGATFTIRIPLIGAQPNPTGLSILPPIRDEIALSESTPKLTGLRVLVVDDHPEARDLLAVILNLSEAEVQTAGSVSEALDRLTIWQPEVLISDIAMPNGDGYELIQRLRQREQAEGVRAAMPAIALTAYAGAEDRIRALSAGFQLYLPKPVEADELIMSVASLTGKLARRGGAVESDHLKSVH
ncbi:MAG TPA: response regulator [Blastocatellia bacterium]|nr:response regulator [Blastocatellia bacterium]